MKNTDALRNSLLGVSVVMFLIAGFFVNYEMNLYAIRHSQHNWCITLKLLTAHPVSKPAPGNTSRLENYEFYKALLTLKSQFGC